MIHEFENNEETESFLRENNVKFSGDCLTLLKMLYSGIRLSGYDVVSKYGMDSRRLREMFTARPDIVRKEWVKNKEGKRQYVQYYIIRPMTPTKAAAIEMGERILKQMKDNELNQGELFE
jgi:hypothetical protein